MDTLHQNCRFEYIRPNFGALETWLTTPRSGSDALLDRRDSRSFPGYKAGYMLTACVCHNSSDPCIHITRTNVVHVAHIVLRIGKRSVAVEFGNGPVVVHYGESYAAKSKSLNASLNFSTSCSSWACVCPQSFQSTRRSSLSSFANTSRPNWL